jgi:hypothetical protein
MAELQTSVPAALTFAGGLWRTALPKVWAPLLALAVCNFVLSPAVHPAPILLPLLVVVDVLALVLAYGALMRLALGDLHAGDPAYKPGPAGLQWMRIETRTLGSVLLLAVLGALLTIATVFFVMLVTIVVAAVTGAAPKAGGSILAGPSVVALWVSLAAAIVLIVWTFIRLSLSMPATVDRQQVQVFSTWGLTRGRVLPLFLALLAATLPTLVLSVAVRALQGQGALPVILWALYALVAGFAQTPLVAGVTAWFYRQGR